MTTFSRALIVDDDPDSVEFLRFKLTRRFPNMQIETRNCPDVSGNYDLYFLDNDFGGCRLAAILASKIRSQQPNSLIIGFSSYLDVDTLKGLIDAGCASVCDKRSCHELVRMLDVVECYTGNHAEFRERSVPSRGLIGTIQSITELLREWNLRLASCAVCTGEVCGHKIDDVA